MFALVASRLQFRSYQHRSDTSTGYSNTIHSIAPRLSPEDTHKLMGFYMEVLILGVIL